jgi:hypothetical protein
MIRRNDLHDKSGRRAVKVDEVRPDGMLPPELPTVELTQSQAVPQPKLSRRHRASQVAGQPGAKGRHFRQDVAWEDAAQPSL